MKKFLAILVVACCLYAATATFVATASTDVELSVAEIAKKDQRVVAAIAVVECRTCVVALQTKGFATRSSYNEFAQTLSEEIKEKFEIDNVYISRSPKVMMIARQIANADKTERQQIIERLLKQLANCPTTLPMP